MNSKSGQMKMSFSMIFSIILIVLFIILAIWAINKFMNIQKNVEIKQFVENIEKDVNNMWRSSQGSQEVEYRLPSKVQEICFVDREYENLAFKSDEFIEGSLIEHIDIEKITEDGPLCFKVSEGKIKMLLSKDFNEQLVTISSV